MSTMSEGNLQDQGPRWWDGEVLAKANIMPATGLATDYLNVFNEAVMLFGLLPAMHDMIEELRVWQPLTYEQHFERSGFAARELAILAYKNADPAIKEPFDSMIQTTAALLSLAIVQASDLIKAKADLAEFVSETNLALQSAILMLDGMIHGGLVGGAQDDIDALFD